MVSTDLRTEYRVDLGDLFSGPLDLLLYLVRRNELNILDLPIARITAEFQRYLEVLEFIDLELVGEFLVMAATLAEIKSRMVLPRAAEVEPEESEPEVRGDPRSELVRQLLEYKKFKDAAKALEERAAAWQDRYPRLANERPSQGKDPSADRIKEVELWDLVSALARVLERKVLEQEAKIRYDETPIAVYVEQIADLVRGKQVAVFSDEPYCHMVWNGRHHSLLAEPDMLGQAVAAYTFSKSYSMSGWRLGFAVTDQAVVEVIGKMINTSLSCVPPMVQLAGLAALKHDHAERDKNMEQFKRKVQLLVTALNRIDGIRVVPPAGTFYV
ncbi:MAG TPA: aminotransferase class I/II-fold pyridoxal phosphate-dependent enzyme, partial [Planctomycetaceae bacterium]|nr:aminotransferase class I/II-fold pyridoxal phosphate-dependent enzyme [Planctomycetaceae bacterium]